MINPEQTPPGSIVAYKHPLSWKPAFGVVVKHAPRRTRVRFFDDGSEHYIERAYLFPARRKEAGNDHG